MLAIGIILILVAAGGGGYLGYLASQTSADVVIGSSSTTSIALSMLPLTLFGAGVASVIVLWIGWKLAGAGFRRKRAQRRELRDLRATGGPTSSGGSTASPTP